METENKEVGKNKLCGMNSTHRVSMAVLLRLPLEIATDSILTATQDLKWNSPKLNRLFQNIYSILCIPM